MIISEFNEKPDFVNPEGVKWWVDKATTLYARQDNDVGKSLPRIQVWYVEKPDGLRTRLIIEDGTVIFESTQIEAIEPIERRLDMPVVNSNQAVLWACMKRLQYKLGAARLGPGLGRLVRGLATV